LTDLFNIAIQSVERVVVQTLIHAVQGCTLGTRAVAPFVHVAKFIHEPLHPQLILEPQKLT